MRFSLLVLLALNTASAQTVYTAGRNFGQLGLGDTDNRNTFQPIASLGSDTVTIGLGHHSNAAIKATGELDVMGVDYKGILGLGLPFCDSFWDCFPESLRTSPVRLASMGNDNAMVAAHWHQVLLKTSGEVYTWGGGDGGNAGQLGLGDYENQNVPQQVTLVGADNVFVDVAFASSYAIKASGALYSWGTNNGGPLGLGVWTTDLDPQSGIDQRNTPQHVVAAGSDNLLVAAGGRSVLLLKATGAVYGFGDGSRGQLGLEEDASLGIIYDPDCEPEPHGCNCLRCRNAPAPVTALGTDNALIACPGDMSVVLKTTGEVYIAGMDSWGHGGLGLGQDVYDNLITDSGNRKYVYSFTQIESLGSDNAMVAAANNKGIALKTTGHVYTWGAGDSGANGLGDNVNYNSPQLIALLGTNNAAVFSGDSSNIVLKGPAPFTAPCQIFNFACGCPPGEYDHDSDPATACLACDPGNVTDALGASGASTCTPCRSGHYDDDLDSSTVCVACAAGAFSAATTCNQCLEGTADLDANPATECEPCPLGSFGGHPGQTSCDMCAPGTADLDQDPTTACDVCEQGYYAPVQATNCFPCQAGYIDHDADPSTPCNSTELHLCPPGSFAAASATQCTHCAPGFADEDSDPSTPCSECTSGHEQIDEGQTICQPCTSGRADTDSDTTTPCVLCEAGMYAPSMSSECFTCPAGEADLDGDPATACATCPPGTFAAEAATACQVCVAGTYDDDADSSSSCVQCTEGTYTIGELSACTDCHPGQADKDADASTPCEICENGTFAAAASTTCQLCTPGLFDGDGNAATACQACPRGQYSSNSGRVGGCDDCAAGQYGSNYASPSADNCEACASGQFAASGSTRCVACVSGTADEDRNTATPCTACPSGTFAGCASVECQLCRPGSSDVDLDPATPCVDCVPGTQWQYNGEGHSIATCVACLAGQADHDGDSMTACLPCPVGQYAGSGSTACEDCALTNTIDHDNNPSTPCISAEGVCTQLCDQGTEDADCNTTTPCTDCAVGQFSDGGVTQCRPCAPGSYALPGSSPSDCQACPTGTADADENQWTPCQTCAPGKFTADNANELVTSNATQCANCPPGTVDVDVNASTACSLCDPGRANPDTRSIHAGACAQCAPGKWSYLEGTSVCPDCPDGTFRGLSDLEGGCVHCDASLGEMCPAGSSFPLAAGGYFAQLEVDETNETTTSIVACLPFPYACLGTCSRDVKAFLLTQEFFAEDDQALSLVSCLPGLEKESCTEGYEGPRCSRCTPFSKDIPDPCPDAPNGYYRLETRCEPCPCTWVKFHHMVTALFFGALLMMLVLDHYITDSQAAEHASTLAAPLLILISFCQTIAVFLDTEIPWPDSFRKLMVVFSFVNFNLELVRPECTGEFGPLTKVKAALAVPLFCAIVVASYGFIKLVQIHNVADASSSQRRSARNQLRRRIASVGATLFTVGAIFFVKNFLRAFDCEKSGKDGSRSFMQNAPEIECYVPESDHADILILSKIGLAIFVGGSVAMLVLLMRAHHSDDPGLGSLAFVGDKFEDHFYYWELVIVTRKVLLMSSVLLCRRLVAVLLATFLTIISLSIHIAAWPFEDDGTNYTEMLLLIAQLITLVSGPVFIVLVRARTSYHVCGLY